MSIPSVYQNRKGFQERWPQRVIRKDGIKRFYRIALENGQTCNRIDPWTLGLIMSPGWEGLPMAKAEQLSREEAKLEGLWVTNPFSYRADLTSVYR